MIRKKQEEHENHERWLVSYADFITLLFAFFVVMYATSTQNEEKEKRFENSIREKFRLVGAAGGKSAFNGGIMGNVVDPIEVMQNKNASNEELQESIDKLLQAKLTPEERRQAIGGLRHDDIGVRISLAASTFFPSGSDKLKPQALKSLDKIAQILKEGNHRLIIEGHTDDTPVIGAPYDSNWELASLRATTVVKYLIKYHKINAKRLAAISYADQKPLVDNTTDSNRSLNRRIEILIINSDGQED